MNARMFVKDFCNHEGINYEKVAEILSERTGRYFSKKSLTEKLHKDTLRFTDVLVLADALGYDIKALKRQNNRRRKNN